MPVLSFVFSKKFERFIIIVILINAICLGLETSKTVMQNFGPFLAFLDRLALLIYTFEILIKIIALKKNYIRDPWNIFDFIIVFISYIPASAGLTVMRSLRVLRVLLLISAMPRLRIIVRSLIIALPNIASIALLLLLIFYVAAVIATHIFGSAFPAWFGSLPESTFTLFQLMTLESWAMGIVRPVCEQFPYAAFFFVPFVLFTAFIVLNIFIAVIINGMNEARDQVLKAERNMLIKALKDDDLERIYLKLDDIGEEISIISETLKKMKDRRLSQNVQTDQEND